MFLLPLKLLICRLGFLSRFWLLLVCFFALFFLQASETKAQFSCPLETSDPNQQLDFKYQALCAPCISSVSPTPEDNLFGITLEAPVLATPAPDWLYEGAGYNIVDLGQKSLLNGSAVQFSYSVGVAPVCVFYQLQWLDTFLYVGGAYDFTVLAALNGNTFNLTSGMFDGDGTSMLCNQFSADMFPNDGSTFVDISASGTLSVSAMWNYIGFEGQPTPSSITDHDIVQAWLLVPATSTVVPTVAPTVTSTVVPTVAPTSAPVYYVGSNALSVPVINSIGLVGGWQFVDTLVSVYLPESVGWIADFTAFSGDCEIGGNILTDVPRQLWSTHSFYTSGSASSLLALFTDNFTYDAVSTSGALTGFSGVTFMYFSVSRPAATYYGKITQGGWSCSSSFTLSGIYPVIYGAPPTPTPTGLPLVTPDYCSSWHYIGTPDSYYETLAAPTPTPSPTPSPTFTASPKPPTPNMTQTLGFFGSPSATWLGWQTATGVYVGATMTMWAINSPTPSPIYTWSPSPTMTAWCQDLTNYALCTVSAQTARAQTQTAVASPSLIPFGATMQAATWQVGQVTQVAGYRTATAVAGEVASNLQSVPNSAGGLAPGGEYGTGGNGGSGAGLNFNFSLSVVGGSCILVIPDFDLGIVRLRPVQVCVRWVSFPEMELFGIPIPFDAILIFPLMAIAGWILRL